MKGRPEGIGRMAFFFLWLMEMRHRAELSVAFTKATYDKSDRLLDMGDLEGARKALYLKEPPSFKQCWWWNWDSVFSDDVWQRELLAMEHEL